VFANAIPDSFEDQDLSEYVGSTNDFAFTTSRSFDGSVALEKAQNGSSHSTIRFDESLSSDSKSKTASLYFYYSGSDSAAVTIVNSSGDGYMSYYFGGGPELQLVRIGPDSYQNNISSTGVSLTSGNWYELRLTHDGADGFTADLLDDTDTLVDSVTGSSTTYSGLDRVGINSFSAGTPIDLLDLQ